MSNLLTATVNITGIRPFLWNAFTLDAIPLVKNREETGVRGNDPQEWRRSVLVTPTRQLYVENTYIFGCLRDGAKYIKKGRASIQTLVVATLQVLDQRVLTNCFLPAETELTTDPSAPVYLYICSVRNPSTDARNIRYRVAAAPGWRMSFRLLWDATLVNREQMKSVTEQAGCLCGVGDGRNIGFGRFEVNSFEVQAWIPTTSPLPAL